MVLSKYYYYKASYNGPFMNMFHKIKIDSKCPCTYPNNTMRRKDKI